MKAGWMLLAETCAVGIASDILSLDIASSQTFETHYALLRTNRWGLENIAPT